jgi:hypothetical protein
MKQNQRPLPDVIHYSRLPDSSWNLVTNRFPDRAETNLIRQDSLAIEEITTLTKSTRDKVGAAKIRTAMFARTLILLFGLRSITNQKALNLSAIAVMMDITVKVAKGITLFRSTITERMSRSGISCSDPFGHPFGRNIIRSVCNNIE